MKLLFCFGILAILMLFSLVGLSAAVEAPLYIIHIQGGESRITNGLDGNMEISIMDISQNASILNGNMSSLIPVEGLTNLTCPVDAAVVFSDTQGENISMVNISQVTLSDDAKNLSLQVSPLRFYDGDGLTSFAGNQTAFPSGQDVIGNLTDMYIETRVDLTENSWVVQ